MITVIHRPLGHKLSDEIINSDAVDSGGGAELDAELDVILSDSSGDAIITTPFAHGLVTGDYVYIQSIVESYNGFFYVDSVAYNEFKIKYSENGDYVPWIRTVEIAYQVSVLQHGWLSISQPIVYELYSDLWPNNIPEESYTPRTIVSQADAEGYTQLNLNYALNQPYALDYISLVGDGDLAGPYRIIRVLQPWSIIIDLVYSASNVFTGYQVVKYYKNYCINVDIYAGLDTDHPWYAQKPYTLASTLRFVPGEDGHVKFSISDILKGYIRTRNNLTLDTLPNNLDFMTGFYIAYYESYDSSDGEEIATVSNAPTSDKDNFEGHAVNSDMPFKSIYISHMSDYLNEGEFLAEWLVIQETPVVVVGYFFDMSFINSIPGADILILRNGVLYLTIVNPGVGIIRVPIEVEELGEACFVAYTDTHFETIEIPPELADLSTMTNEPAGGDLPNWTLGSQPFIIGQSQSDNLSLAMTITSGSPFTVNYRFTIANKAAGFGQVVFESLTGAFASVEQVVIDDVDANGTYEGSVTFPATGNADYFTVTFQNGFIWDMTVEELSFGDPTIEEVEVAGVQVTEPKCVMGLMECDSTFIPDEIRLTEGGDFRILE